VWKDRDEFSKDRKGRDGLCARCKACRREYKIRYDKENSARIREEKRERQAHAQVYLLERKSMGCLLCPRQDLPFHFHHVDPATKLFNPTHGRCLSRERLDAELAKCVVLCSSCHAKVHAGTAQLPENP